MMRFLAFLGALLLGLAAAHAAPIDNKDGFWSAWSDATFERAAAEKKFVIVSLQSWWCPWCHAMNRDTWANPDVRGRAEGPFRPGRMSTRTAAPTSPSATSAGAGPPPSSSAPTARRS